MILSQSEADEIGLHWVKYVIFDPVLKCVCVCVSMLSARR